MNVPPLPPNGLLEKDSDLFIYGNLEPVSICMGKGEDKSWRAVIAAVARCAWLDEAKKLQQESFAQVSKDDGYKMRQDAMTAQDNADAWDAWGKGKEFEK